MPHLKIKKDVVHGEKRSNPHGIMHHRMSSAVEAAIQKDITKHWVYPHQQRNRISKAHLEGNVYVKVTMVIVTKYTYSLAMKWHPDRFTDAKEKKQAKEKFQTISSAYSVLRDGIYL